MLHGICPSDVKKLNIGEMNVLCDEIRTKIYETVTTNGGHLSSNLGVVEPTVALFHSFDFPKDKIVFDVGHQCYAYKLLSDREGRFSTLRQRNGISGFPKRSESIYDFYDTGHAGTSLSAAIGIAKARDLKKENYNVIAFIGDGSFNNGLVYEALCSLSIVKTKILIVLNDNGMSISPTVGGMSEILTTLKTEPTEDRIRLLENFGLKYLYCDSGNDVESLLKTIATAKEDLEFGSVLLHIHTKKGKGYGFSEEHPDDTHGISPNESKKTKEYSKVLGDTLCELAETDEKIVAVTAAMTESLGLGRFFDKFPSRAFDVGICEENACVLCASLASNGMKPYYAIYSTFLERTIDEIIHDVSAQDLAVTFCIDRAGISGADGETHQGVFDLSYLTMIPNMTVLAPKDLDEFESAIRFSKDFMHPLAIRYPRCGGHKFDSSRNNFTLSWEYLVKDEKAKITILATGERTVSLAMSLYERSKEQGRYLNVINARTVKPLDSNVLSKLQGQTVITLEDNVKKGGFGESVLAALNDIYGDKMPRIRIYAYEDKFIPHGGVLELQKDYGLNEDDILDYISGLKI